MKLLVCILAFSLVQFVLGQDGTSRIGTLYRSDPIQDTFSFTFGTHGHQIENNVVTNVNSDMDYSNYDSGYLTVGIEGGRLGRIVDLGSQSALSAEYGYSETVGQGQGYASIQFASNTSEQLIIATSTQFVMQNLTETSDLYSTPTSSYSSYPYVDHIYLIRITDTYDLNFEKVVKMLILAVNYDYVVFRYDVLRDLTTGMSPPNNDSSQIFTMYPLDDEDRTLSFTLGIGGLCYCEAYYCDYCEQCNCNSDLDFEWYGADALSSGIEGGRIANIVDVGTELDNYNTYALNLNYFASIRLSGNTVIVGTNTLYNLRNETGALFSTPSPYYVSVPAYEEHIYLVRIKDTYDATFERIAKLLVLHIDDNTRLILRFDVLRDTQPAQPFQDRSDNGTFITTMYASDPETSFYDFGHAASGGIITQGGVYNRGSDIAFNNYFTGGFSVGIEGGEEGIILDLGTTNSLFNEYNPHLNGLYNAFAGLFFNTSNNNTVMLNRSMDYPIAENAFLQTDNTTARNAYIYEDHVYIVRLWDSNDSTFRRVVKIKVLHANSDEVTFRWVNIGRELGGAGSTSDSTSIGLALLLLIAAFLLA